MVGVSHSSSSEIKEYIQDSWESNTTPNTQENGGISFKMNNKWLSIAIFMALYINLSRGYSALEDARIIAEYKKSIQSKPDELNHAEIARKLVHQTDWAAVGTISQKPAIKDYPMVNIISINDNDGQQKSTGRIQFLLTDLDFTGADRKVNNRTTFLFTDEQRLHCSQAIPSTDPMEPKCARAVISGQIKKLDKDSPDYSPAEASFIKRHPAAENWIKRHNFYLCELEIENIYVLDSYGGPQNIKADDYYNIKLE
ncbi:protein CREG1-like [Musca vetustissima]|uniref:protein CREG1-like n=1 Tax=Musca vetustissima TaxID=27455 RepID=UPI002AB73D38|nr:protein CREG1-like [Musca vetustissima]